MNAENGSNSSGGTMLRMLGAAQKREVKATQNLAIIVLFFMICWIPLYTINCVLAFCNDCEVNGTFMNCCIILSHLNSAGNPLLYAYHLRDFRAALKNFFCSFFGDGQGPPAEITKFRSSLPCKSTFNNGRLKRSLRGTRSVLSLPNQSKFMNSPICCRIKSRSMHLPVPQKIITSPAVEFQNREIWKIPELPSSVSDEKEHIAAGGAAKQTTNNAYCHQNYILTDEDDDDEVFIDDTMPITELKKYGIIIQPPTKNRINNECAVISVSSPQLLPGNLFLVEQESGKLKSSCRNCGATDSGKQMKNGMRLSRSGDFSGGSSHQGVKVSPFKTMSGLWLLKRRSRSMSDSSSVSGCSSNAGMRKHCVKNNSEAYSCGY